MRHWVAAFSILLTLTALHADARKGELFGYRIGDRYPVSNSTTGRLHWAGISLEIFAEKANKPTNIGNVVVTTTLGTYTIVAIRSDTEFKDYGTARRFALGYSDLLKARYRFKNWNDDYAILRKGFSASDDYSDKREIWLSVDLNADYRLRIFLPAPKEPDMTEEEFAAALGMTDEQFKAALGRLPSRTKTNTVSRASPSPQTVLSETQRSTVEISLVPIGALSTNLEKQAESEYNAGLVEAAKKRKLLDGL